jgi:hypothetical protein
VDVTHKTRKLRMSEKRRDQLGDLGIRGSKILQEQDLRK